jgi:hypothetical protein
MNTIAISISTSLDLPAARQLRDGLATLLRAERTAAADFLVALAAFDRRRGWEPLGHATLFAFLRAELRLSSGAAFWRMSASRLLQRFPDLIEPLRDGRLCLSTTAELAKVLTEENRTGVLPRFFGLSAREAREVTASLLPREAPPLRPVVTSPGEARTSRAVQTSAADGPLPLQSATTASLETGQVAASVAFRTSETLPADSLRDGQRADVEALTADLRRLHVTVSRRFLKKVEMARDGLAHALPGATTEQVLEAALDLLLEKQARARGQVKRPRASVPESMGVAVDPGSGPADAAPSLSTPPLTEPPPPRRAGPREHVPAAVRRAVWERDGGRCQWPVDSGGCCGSTHRIELDHLVPWARWGPPTVDGLRLLCHPHNRLAARLAFGARVMNRYAGAPGYERGAYRARREPVDPESP